MLEIAPRSETEKEFHISQLRIKCNLLDLPPSEISERFLASCIQDLIGEL